VVGVNIKMKIMMLLLFLSSFILLGENTNKEYVSSNINRAKAFYEYGNYNESIKILNELLKKKENLNSSSLLNIYQLIARAEYYNKNLEYSEYYLKLLFLFKSNYHFDPVFVNPNFIDFANKVYLKYESEIIRNQKDLSELLRKKNPDKYSDVNSKKSFYKNFLPFGFGQFQNTHKYKGYMLASVETLFLVTSVTSYFLLKYYQKDDYTFDNNDLASSGKVINNVSFYMLGLVYLYATIDGIVYYNASNINVIQSRNIEFSPIITSDFKYVSFKIRF
jgi:hypothetical protein